MNSNVESIPKFRTLFWRDQGVARWTSIAKGYLIVDDTAMKTKMQFAYWINLYLDFNARARSKKKLINGQEPFR